MSYDTACKCNLKSQCFQRSTDSGSGFIFLALFLDTDCAGAAAKSLVRQIMTRPWSNLAGCEDWVGKLKLFIKNQACDFIFFQTVTSTRQRFSKAPINKKIARVTSKTIIFAYKTWKKEEIEKTMPQKPVL